MDVLFLACKMAQPKENWVIALAPGEARVGIVVHRMPFLDSSYVTISSAAIEQHDRMAAALRLKNIATIVDVLHREMFGLAKLRYGQSQGRLHGCKWLFWGVQPLCPSFLNYWEAIFCRRLHGCGGLGV
jgi:hypothetical protein